jgi:hypothetical protein
MKSDIAQYVSECDACRLVKAEHQRPAGVLQPLKTPERKWANVDMDFVTGFSKSRKGNDAIFPVIGRLVGAESLSPYLLLLPLTLSISLVSLLTNTHRLRTIHTRTQPRKRTNGFAHDTFPWPTQILHFASALTAMLFH